MCRPRSLKPALHCFGSYSTSMAQWLFFFLLLRTKIKHRRSGSEAAALLLMLYLPEGNHCGGSSEPAWVASSWVLTPPTQSSPPPLLGPGSPPLSREDGSPREEAPDAFPRGCSSQAAVSRDSHRASEESEVTTKGETRPLWGLQLSDAPPLFDCSVLVLLETRPPILWKCCCCCLFTPFQSERSSSKVAQLPFLAHQRPRS